VNDFSFKTLRRLRSFEERTLFLQQLLNRRGKNSPSNLKKRALFFTPKELATGAFWGSRRELFEGELLWRWVHFGVEDFQRNEYGCFRLCEKRTNRFVFSKHNLPPHKEWRKCVYIESRVFTLSNHLS